MTAPAQDDVATVRRIAGGERAFAEIRDLTDAIVERFHDAHRRELPELIRLAERVEMVHRDCAETPSGLADVLRRMLGDLTTHMAKEEIVVFPRMRRGGGAAPLDRPLAALIAEHDRHAVQLVHLRAMTNDFTPPVGACSKWRALYAGLAQFAADLAEHIAIENEALFPRFAS